MWSIMVDGFPGIDDGIRKHVQDNWTADVLSNSQQTRALVRELRSIVVDSPAESDCRSVSEAVSIALDELGVEHRLVRDGLYDDGDLVPHSWVIVTYNGRTIIDGTAEQFNDPELSDVGVVTPDSDAWDNYKM